MQKYVNTRLLRNSGDPDLNNTIEFSHHPDLTLEILKTLPDKAWGFQGFHNHPNFTFQWVLDFPNKFWDWNRLSEKVDLDTIAKNSNFPWNWCLLTNRFCPKEILRYPGLSWDFSMFHVPDITDEYLPLLEEFQHLIPDWKWHYIAKGTHWSVFKKALHLPWLWFIGDVRIRTKEFLPEDVCILRDFEILCNWVKLSIYVHVDIIHAHPDLPWSTEFLQWNRSTWKTPVEPIEKCIRDWVAANRIKTSWKRAISDPSFKMCRDRIYREFKELERFTSRRMSSSTISFTKLREDAIIPSKDTPGSIGLDLYSVESYVVFPGQRVVVSTGVKAVLPEGGGVYGRIAPRSGLAVKHGLDVGAGVVDPGDQSEIRVVLFNHDDHRPFVIRPGYRIAQLILERAVDSIDVVELEPDFSAEVV
jgi:dUTP pyrophosphatase